jgi:hypothetical protein
VARSYQLATHAVEVSVYQPLPKELSLSPLGEGRLKHLIFGACTASACLPYLITVICSFVIEQIETHVTTTCSDFEELQRTTVYSDVKVLSLVALLCAPLQSMLDLFDFRFTSRISYTVLIYSRQLSLQFSSQYQRNWVSTYVF